MRGETVVADTQIESVSGRKMKMALRGAPGVDDCEVVMCSKHVRSAQLNEEALRSLRPRAGRASCCYRGRWS